MRISFRKRVILGIGMVKYLGFLNGRSAYLASFQDPHVGGREKNGCVIPRAPCSTQG